MGGTTGNIQNAVHTLCWGVGVLQPRLDRLVLLVEEGHVRHEILDNIHCVCGVNVNV